MHLSMGEGNLWNACLRLGAPVRNSGPMMWDNPTKTPFVAKAVATSLGPGKRSTATHPRPCMVPPSTLPARSEPFILVGRRGS